MQSLVCAGRSARYRGPSHEQEGTSGFHGVSEHVCGLRADTRLLLIRGAVAEPSPRTGRSGKNVRSVVRRGTVTSWTRGIVVAFTLLHARHERTRDTHRPALRLAARCTVVHCCASLRQRIRPIIIRKIRTTASNPRCFVANRVLSNFYDVTGMCSFASTMHA